VTSFDSAPGDPPVVSVLIAAHNAANVLSEQLAALSAQAHEFSWEVVVVDHASTDGTAEVARAWSDRLPIRVIEAPAGGGAGRARNAGLEVVGGTYLLVCDADDIVEPDWVDQMVRALEHADVVGGPRRPFAANRRHYTLLGLRPGELMAEVLVGGARLLSPSGCNLGLRRSALGSVRFPEDYDRIGGEDIAFCWLLQRAGAVLAPAPQAIVNYRLRSTTGKILQQHFFWGMARGKLLRDFPDVAHARRFVGVVKMWVCALFELIVPNRTPGRSAASLRLANLAGRLVGSVRFRVKAW